MNIYNPTTNAWETGVAGPGGTTPSFLGGCLLPNGKVMCAPHTHTGSHYLYDPILNVWEAGLPANDFSGGEPGFTQVLLMPNGKVYFVHGGSEKTTNIYTPMGSFMPATPWCYHPCFAKY